jgi:nitric oxide reductase large subunit
VLSGLALMAFLGVLSFLFFSLSWLSKKLGLSDKAQNTLAVVLLILGVACFGLFFGFDGFTIQDWSERARR